MIYNLLLLTVHGKHGKGFACNPQIVCGQLSHTSHYNMHTTDVYSAWDLSCTVNGTCEVFFIPCAPKKQYPSHKISMISVTEDV